MDYINIINFFNARDEDYDQTCTLKEILGHSNQGISYELQILCDTNNNTWEPLTGIKLLDFMSVAEYVHAKFLISLP